MIWKSVKEKDELINRIKDLWENDHAEDIADSYNKIVAILQNLDIYSANMVINLVAFQTTQKSYLATVGKKEIGGEKDGGME